MTYPVVKATAIFDSKSVLRYLGYTISTDRQYDDVTKSIVNQLIGKGFRLGNNYSGAIVPGGAFEASVTLRNYGFSTPVKPRRPEFVLATPAGEAVELPADFDCRALQPVAEDGAPLAHEIALATTLPADMPPGPWCLGLWLPDPDPRLRYRPEYAVRLATAMPTTVVGGRLLNVLN